MPAGEALADDLGAHAEVGGAARAAQMGDVAGEVLVIRGRRAVDDGVRGGNGGVAGGGGVGRVGAGMAATERQGRDEVSGEDGRWRVAAVDK